MTKNVRWSLIVSRDIDQCLRTFLAQRGMRKGDLSKFVEEAVRWRVLDLVVSETKTANMGVPTEEIEAAITEAIEAVRADHQPG